MVRRCRFCQSAFELYCFWPGGKDPASQPGLDTQHSLFSIDKTTWGSNAPPSQPNFHGTSVSYAPLSAFEIESPSCYAPTFPVASSKIRPSIICPQLGSVTPITAKPSYRPLTSNRILSPHLLFVASDRFFAISHRGAHNAQGSLVGLCRRQHSQSGQRRREAGL